ncbi:MAG: helix-turn-helix domain-containing protein [Clostridia bacterium]|nr:helix-turn-helix domain-containing protein [Clostridia bacterium]
MSHLNDTTKNRKGKRLNYEERTKIEALSKIGMKSEKIAKEFGCSGRTVRRELAKGRTELLNSDYTTRIEYSADIGQQKHDYAATGKGPMPKIGNDFELVKEIEKLIIDEKMSHYAAAETINSSGKFKTRIYLLQDNIQLH